MVRKFNSEIFFTLLAVMNCFKVLLSVTNFKVASYFH